MSKKILLVGEDEQLCNLMAPLLQARGHIVEPEISGHMALLRLCSELPDMVIVGEQLTDIDGVGWIAKMRQTHKDLLVVFVAQIWRDSEFYGRVTKELKVSQIFYRPIKSNLFAVQIESLWADRSSKAALVTGSLAKIQAAAGGSVVGPGAITSVLPVATLQQPIPVPEGGTSSLSALADATIVAFRQKFSRAVPVRVKQILDILNMTVHESPDPEMLIEARRLSHNLKGTALSCGFERLGTLSEKIELSMRNLLESPDVNVRLEWVNLDDAAIAMEKESDLIRMQFLDYIPAEDDRRKTNRNSARARVLVVSRDFVPELSGPGFGGMPLDVIGAETAELALEKASKYQLDAALIEIRPEFKGVAFELARDLRSLSGYDNLPLGFISKNEESDRAEAAHAGASLFLEKPYGPESLQSVLQHLITIRDGGRWKVLLVDDDSDFTDMVSDALGNEGMLVRSLNDPSTVLDVLDEFNPDLMLLDVMMQGTCGFDVCKQIRAGGRWQDLPIIFLTAQTDLRSRLASFDAGGDDYLPKPVINVELLKRVKIRLDRARMARERQDRDVLTGLLLRRAFVDQLTGFISECQRHGFVFSLCLLDIDHFKQVNDQHGHIAGDRVLDYIGKLLRKRFRVEDLRGRWGGEEFILAFRHEMKETMHKALNRVLEELRTIEFKGDQGELFSVTFSAGIVDYPVDGTTIHDLVIQADRRLYKAKENGRNQIVIEG